MSRRWIHILLLFLGMQGLLRVAHGQIFFQKNSNRHLLTESWSRISDTSRSAAVPLAHLSEDNVKKQGVQTPRHSLRIGGGMDASRGKTSEFTEKFLLDYSYQKGNGLTDGLDLSLDYSNLFLENKREFGGHFNYTKRFRKITYHSRYLYHNATSYSNSWEEQDYFSTDLFDHRFYEQTTFEKNRAYVYSTTQGIEFLINGVNVNLNGQYAYRVDKNRSNNKISSSQDDQVMTRGDLWHSCRNSASQGTATLLVSRSRKSSTLNISSVLNLEKGVEKGLQLDTLGSSDRHIDLSRDWDSRYLNWRSAIDFSSVISPQLKLLFKGDYKYSESSLKGVGEHRPTGLLDTNDTRNYTFYNSISGVGGTLFYRGEKVEISGGCAVRYLSRNQVDRFPARKQNENHFLFFEPQWNIRLTLSPTLDLSADYKVNTKLPSDLELHNVIDDANPLCLSAGNPDLKLEKDHLFVIQCNKKLEKRSSALETKIQFTLTKDPIASNSRYFGETVCLLGYNYTILKGATLNTYENSDPGYEFSVRVAYEKLWPSFGKCRFTPKYGQKKIPSFTQGERNDLKTRGGGMELQITTLFSKKVKMELFSNTEFSRLDSRLGRANNFLREWITWSATTSLIPKCTVEVLMKSIFRKNLTNHQKTNATMLNLAISRSFGKSLSLVLRGENLLDSTSDKMIGRMTEYEYRKNLDQTGRYVTLQLSCKF